MTMRAEMVDPVAYPGFQHGGGQGAVSL